MGDCGSQVGRRIVPECDDPRVTIQRRLDDAALDTAATPMHETYFLKAGKRGGFDVFGDNRWDVFGRERVEIELAFDRNADGIVNHGL